MIIGLSLVAFTALHVIISLVGLLAGAAAVVAMLTDKRPGLSTAIFLCATVLTSATGFLFHSAKIGPPHIVGVLSLIVLALACAALYAFHLKGAWRPVYVVSALVALYFNAFVGVVQAFDKIAPLKALAPTGSEPPFLVAQVAVLAGFVILGFLATKRFHPMLAQPA
ncbi:MAG: hypothetical protein ACXU82_04995 [Caulobacteraceae bacterium]